MDLEDSLDSLFGSVSNSPTSHLKSNAIADEDKRREARLVQQKQQKQAGAEEDVDSLLSELRNAKGGSMARTAANIIDKRSPTSASSPSSGASSPSSAATSPPGGKGGRGARRRDEGTSMAKDAEAFLESSKQQPGRGDSSTDRSRRLGSAAVSWLDSGVSTAKVTSTGGSGSGSEPSSTSSSKGKPSPTAEDDGACVVVA